MSQTKDGGPAFPSTWMETNGYGVQFPCILTGMTLRDWFAGQALVGLLSDPNVTAESGRLARVVYTMADAMLTARDTLNN